VMGPLDQRPVAADSFDGVAAVRPHVIRASPEERTAPLASANTIRECLATVEAIVACYRKRKRGREPRRECLRLVVGHAPEGVRQLLTTLAPPWQDHAIACVYAVLLPRARRRRLGAYFTPPHLVAHLTSRLRAAGLDPQIHRVLDPAAGGAAFLVPLAREVAKSLRAAGMSHGRILSRLRKQLVGRELDAGLADVANALLRRMLTRECGVPSRLVRRFSLVEVGDSLDASASRKIDHHVGNPPYLRLAAVAQRRWKEEFADIANGRLNLYSMFVRRALSEVPPKGLIGYVLPASFVGGPEFASFRRRVLQLGEVLVLDMVEKRTDVFVDAIQDACFLIIRRRAQMAEAPPITPAASGVLRHDGTFVDHGSIWPASDGAPWALPGFALSGEEDVLADYGYKGTVGYLVANRQAELLHRRPAANRAALIWAKCVTPDGRFEFDRGRRSKQADGRGFVEVERDAPYVIRAPCVVVQRTSSRNQARRLTAAPVPRSFLMKYRGIVGENHVIILVPTRADAVSPSEMATVLNGELANGAMARICGSASISVRLLERLPLPPRGPRAAAASVPG
jgi:adenine-specific DNA-methyltransferase